jgi:16S rRNA A1518/A1519 N6-dimethyltransferase RsmA/KsgA/DIM1 with predicted DNA glycosylase/AP lyase activity
MTQFDYDPLYVMQLFSNVPFQASSSLLLSLISRVEC